MRFPRLLSAVVLLALGCGVTQQEGALEDYDELTAPIAGVSCPEDAPREICTGNQDVYTALVRVGRSQTAYSEAAQTFEVTNEGLPGRVTLKLRLLRPLLSGTDADLTVAVRALPTDGVLAVDSSADLARASVKAATLSRTHPSEVTFVLASTTPQAPQRLTPGTTYALVITVGPVPASDAVQVGVASYKSGDPLVPGEVLRRTATSADGSFPARAFVTTDVSDLSFALSLGDGVDNRRVCARAGRLRCERHLHRHRRRLHLRVRCGLVGQRHDLRVRR